MNKFPRLLCAWSGVITLAFMFLGLIVAGWLPVPSPHMTQAEVFKMYTDKTDQIRFFSVMNLVAAGWSVMWVAAISSQLRRIESGRSPMWTYLQLGAGICSSFLFACQALPWTVASFRPERSAEITQALNDMGFLWFLMPVPFVIAGMFAIAMCIFEDKSRKPVYPRWVAYLNLWLIFIWPIAVWTTYAKTGPLAWNGLLVWWIPVVDYTIWAMVMSWATARAITLQHDEEGETTAIDMQYAMRPDRDQPQETLVADH
jgi:hypothetical protein